MGRNKRTSFVENNGANSDTDSVPVAKKQKKGIQPVPKKKEEKKANNVKGKTESTSCPGRVMKKGKMQNIYSDTSTSSESDSEKNSLKNDKKSEKSVTDSNTDSDSDSDSDTTESDSSQVSKTEKDENKKTGSITNSVVNLNPVKRYDPPPKSSGSDSYHSDTEEEDKKRRKKQKEMLKIQLNKKSKRRTLRKQDNFLGKKDVKQDVEEDLKENDEDGLATSVNNDDTVIDWPQADVSELIRRMEEQIPEGDTQKFDSRAARLDWDKIAFDDYSKQECQDMWNQISKRIRRFRKLSEMLDDAREWTKKPWTNFYRGSKKNRHPDMPTKPLSAYMIYYLEQKDRVIQENKGVDLMQISKIITEMYKNLTETERESYSQKAALEKQNFDEKIAEFYKVHPECEPPNQPKSNTRELARGPRKPYPPFKLFFQNEIKNYVTDGSVDRKSFEESAKEKWRNFSDKKKAEWITRSLEDVERYEKEIKAYRVKNPEFTVPNCSKSILNREERLIMERLSGKPVKPPNSAYSLFSRYMLQSDNDVKSKAPKLRMAEISKKWKEISASEKYRYEEKVKELQDEYKEKLQNYLKSLSPEEREKEMDFVKKQKRKTKEKIGKKELKSKNTGGKTKSKIKGSPSYQFYDGEPKPPPSSAYDLFVEKLLADRPSGMSEEAKHKLASEKWNKLPESKKQALQNELDKLKKKYIADIGGYFNKLSVEELKALTAKKKLAQSGTQLERVNGTLSDSNDESEEEKGESSSESSDSDDSDSGKSNSSSEDSDG